MKEAPNHILKNIIGSAQTSRKILEGGDIPIFSVVLMNLDHMLLITGSKSVLHYPHSARRLIQSVYDRIFSASIRQ